jgi:hypothetical protein
MLDEAFNPKREEEPMPCPLSAEAKEPIDRPSLAHQGL